MSGGNAQSLPTRFTGGVLDAVILRLGDCGEFVGWLSELPLWPGWPCEFCAACPLDCEPPVPVDPLLPVRDVDEPLADEVEVDVAEGAVAVPSANWPVAFVSPATDPPGAFNEFGAAGCVPGCAPACAPGFPFALVPDEFPAGRESSGIDEKLCRFDSPIAPLFEPRDILAVDRTGNVDAAGEVEPADSGDPPLAAPPPAAPPVANCPDPA